MSIVEKTDGASHLSKLYRYKRITNPTADTLKRSATQVLHDKMVFYDDRAIKLYNTIRKKLKEDADKGAPIRGDLMAQMLKHMNTANDIAIECAAKLAPYQSPKLQSMEVNKKVTHRFVIQAPKPIENSQEWLSAAINSNLIEHTPNDGIVQD